MKPFSKKLYQKYPELPTWYAIVPKPYDKTKELSFVEKLNLFLQAPLYLGFSLAYRDSFWSEVFSKYIVLTGDKLYFTMKKNKVRLRYS